MQKKFIPAAVLFVILLVLMAHFGARLTIVPTFTYADEEKRVYLTFDDGPSTIVTNAVLDVLEEENVKATFFVVGARVEGREETLKRIVDEGHTLGVHSSTHDYSKIYASEEAFLADVDDCAAVIKKITGVTPRVYRFPGGGLSKEQKFTPLVEERGYRVVRWNAVSGDVEIPNATGTDLVQRTVDTSKGKRVVVLLLHDSAKNFAVPEALPEIIAYFRAEGYAFCAY